MITSYPACTVPANDVARASHQSPLRPITRIAVGSSDTCRSVHLVYLMIR
jgi:hypothetical protein